jgi:hypothetical protein
MKALQTTRGDVEINRAKVVSQPRARRQRVKPMPHRVNLTDDDASTYYLWAPHRANSSEGILISEIIWRHQKTPESNAKDTSRTIITHLFYSKHKPQKQNNYNISHYQYL